MVNLINGMVSMEIVWRQCGDCVESNTFYGDFMVKLVWRFLGFQWRKHGKPNYQTISTLIIP